MSKELELIADVSAEHRLRESGRLWETCHCGWGGRSHSRHVTAHVVSRLSEHGYSIVQLPKPSADHVMQSGLRYRAWNNTPADAPVVAWEDGEVTVDCHVGGLSRSGAVDLALALLAAAAAAEEDQ